MTEQIRYIPDALIMSLASAKPEVKQAIKACRVNAVRKTVTLEQ